MTPGNFPHSFREGDEVLLSGVAIASGVKAILHATLYLSLVIIYIEYTGSGQNDFDVCA